MNKDKNFKGNVSSLKTLKRLINYVVKEYKFLFFVVTIAIIISSIANVIGTMFLRNLIDDYIAPLMNKSNIDFAPLLKVVLTMVLFIM